MLPISQEFHVPLTVVTAVFTLTLWMRLVGATASGWLADRIGRTARAILGMSRRDRRLFFSGNYRIPAAGIGLELIRA